MTLASRAEVGRKVIKLVDQIFVQVCCRYPECLDQLAARRASRFAALHPPVVCAVPILQRLYYLEHIRIYLNAVCVIALGLVARQRDIPRLSARLDLRGAYRAAMLICKEPLAHLRCTKINAVHTFKPPR